MKIRHHWLVVVLAVVGLTACGIAFARFVTAISSNTLPWYSGLNARDFYVAVGAAYSRGFLVGFFFAFFLVVLSVAVATHVRRRRRRLAHRPLEVVRGER